MMIGRPSILRILLAAVPPWLALGLALAFAFDAGPARAIDIQWQNPAGGSWGDPKNWSPSQLPGIDDRVLITLTGTYTVSVSALDQIHLGELIVGAPSGTQTLDLTPGGGVIVDGAFEIGANAILRLEGSSEFTAYGAALVAGRIEADHAVLEADEGYQITGTIELVTTTMTGRAFNQGVVRAYGYCSFGAVENDAGATFEVMTGPDLFTGAVMDTLLNRGHVTFGPSVTIVAGDLMANEPNAVISVEASTIANAAILRNAGVWRVAAGSHIDGLDFVQLATGEFAPHYDVGEVVFAVVCQNVTLDGTLAPVFEPGFTPPPGLLPLMFTDTITGEFSVVSDAGTGGLAVKAAYLDDVHLQVLGPGLAITPPGGSDLGPVSALISGSDLASVTTARLTRSGQSAIVADPLSRDPDSGVIYATFDLTGRALGAWDVELEGPGGTETAPGAFTIEFGEIVRQPIRVELFGQRLLRLGGSGDWSLAIYNPNKTDARGAVEIVVPPGLGWELTALRPGEAKTRGAAGKFALPTTLIVPDVLAPPGLSLTGVHIRLKLPAGSPLGEGTLQARWYEP
jgi:hypothetical protein